jgi:hypothetical protein
MPPSPDCRIGGQFTIIKWMKFSRDSTNRGKFRDTTTGNDSFQLRAGVALTVAEHGEFIVDVG